MIFHESGLFQQKISGMKIKSWRFPMKTRIILVSMIFASLIISSFTLQADLQQDQTTGRFYSIPMSPNINQTEYNDLMQLCSLMCQARLMYSVIKDTDEETVSMLHSYLQKVGTPTSKRLIADIKKEAKRTV